MRSLRKVLIAAAFPLMIGASQAAFAQETEFDAKRAKNLVTACDSNKDGMVSKAELMAHIGKMFDKMDTKKMGKLDMKQIDALLAELMKTGA